MNTGRALCFPGQNIAHEMRSYRMFSTSGALMRVGADLVRDWFPGQNIAHEMRSYRMFSTSGVLMRVGADLVRDTQVLTKQDAIYRNQHRKMMHQQENQAGNTMNTMKKRNPYRTGALLALLALLQGCATLDKDECMLADWRMIGYEDGVAGRSANRVGEYRKDCAKHAVTPDLEAYRAGREEGLQQYCKVDNGYRLGNAGRGLSAVCPAALQAEFRDAYQAGRKLYLARSAVNNTSARINERRNTLTTLEKNRAQKLASLIADGLQSEQRLMILYDISELQQEMNDVEAEIVDLEYDLEDKQAHLEQLSQNSRY